PIEQYKKKSYGQVYQSRELDRDVDEMNDTSKNVGDVFTHGKQGWVFTGNHERPWQKFVKGQNEEVKCPMPTVKGKGGRVLNTNLGTWVVGTNHRYNTNHRAPRSKKAKRRAMQAKASNDPHEPHDDDDEGEEREEETAGAPDHSNRAPALRAGIPRKCKTKPEHNELSVATDEDDEHQREEIEPKKPHVRTRKGKKKRASSRGPGTTVQDKEPTVQPVKGTKTVQIPTIPIPTVEKHHARLSAAGGGPFFQRENSASQLLKEPPLVQSTQPESPVIPDKPTRLAGPDGSPSPPMGTKLDIIKKVRNIDKRVCPVSQLELLGPWILSLEQSPQSLPVFLLDAREILPKNIAVCSSLRPHVKYLPTQVTKDLFACYQHKPKIQINVEDPGKELPVCLIGVDQLLQAVMFPLHSPPLRSTRIPVMDSTGMKRLELPYESAYEVYTTEKPEVLRMDQLTHTCYTPPGNVTGPRLNPYPADTVIYHCEGRSFWFTFPPTERNLRKFLSIPSCPMGSTRPLEQCLRELDGVEVISMHEAGTTFIIPAGTIHAFITTTTSVHAVAPLISERSLGFSRLYTRLLKETDVVRPEVTAWAASLQDDAFLQQWQNLARRLNKAENNLDSNPARQECVNGMQQWINEAQRWLADQKDDV
ncbi:hypothetical protein V5O48_009135, partial [Marasmius crinis-equi]